MSEPTREQIKEAFKQTIERWEKIIGSLSYKEERWVNITKDCRFDLEGDEFFKIKDKDGSLISIQRNKAQVSYSVGKREHGELTVVFGPPRAGYKFEINRFKNFEILKKLGTEKDCKAKGIGLTEPAATEEKKEEGKRMSLLEKLRRSRHKREAKRKIKQGFRALMWMNRQQMYLGWTAKQRKQFWKDFVHSPASRSRTLVKGLEMVAPGIKHKKGK